MKFDRKALLDKARAYAAKGKLNSAIDLYQQVLRREPGDAATWLKLAETFRRADAKDDAADTYLEAVRAYRHQGFSQKAAAAVEQAVRLRPSAETHVEAGSVYRELSQLGDARKHLRAAAIAYSESRRDAEVIDVLEQLAVIDPNDIETRKRLAELCERADRPDDAVGHRAQLAEIYLRINEPERALRYLKVCYEAQPENTDLLELMARAFEAAGRPDNVQAVRAERDRLLGVDTPTLAAGTARRTPSDTKNTQIAKVFNEAVAYIDGGQRERAIPLLRAIVKTTPGHDEARRVLAELTGDAE